MENKTILVVTNENETMHQIRKGLKECRITQCATTDEKAIELACQHPLPDLILIDIQRPDSQGYGVCRYLKQGTKTEHIPIFFLVAPHDEKGIEESFRYGATDCITTPLTPHRLYARVHPHLSLKEATNLVNTQSTTLEILLLAVGSLAEPRTHETSNHIRRTARFVKILAEGLMKSPRFCDHLTPESIALMVTACPLHDLGMIGIPDAILLKPDKLTDNEFTAIKKHTIDGRDAILSAERQLHKTTPLLEMARNIACSHHERWDGTGYPEGIAGEAIPLPARIMMVADVYDALVTYRIYKPAFSHDVAVEIIEGGGGTQFDPDIVAVFSASQADFQKIALEFSDFDSRRMARP